MPSCPQHLGVMLIDYFLPVAPTPHEHVQVCAWSPDSASLRGLSRVKLFLCLGVLGVLGTVSQFSKINIALDRTKTL